jgi:hypothetical protein
VVGLERLLPSLIIGWVQKRQDVAVPAPNQRSSGPGRGLRTSIPSHSSTPAGGRGPDCVPHLRRKVVDPDRVPHLHRKVADPDRVPHLHRKVAHPDRAAHPWRRSRSRWGGCLTCNQGARPEPGVPARNRMLCAEPGLVGAGGTVGTVTRRAEPGGQPDPGSPCRTGGAARPGVTVRNRGAQPDPGARLEPAAQPDPESPCGTGVGGPARSPPRTRCRNPRMRALIPVARSRSRCASPTGAQRRPACAVRRVRSRAGPARAGRRCAGAPRPARRPAAAPGPRRRSRPAGSRRSSRRRRGSGWHGPGCRRPSAGRSP